MSSSRSLISFWSFARMILHIPTETSFVKSLSGRRALISSDTNELENFGAAFSHCHAISTPLRFCREALLIPNDCGTVDLVRGPSHFWLFVLSFCASEFPLRSQLAASAGARGPNKANISPERNGLRASRRTAVTGSRY